MGTRSLIHFYDGTLGFDNEDPPILCTVYQQYDGYIDGVGEYLLEFIKSGTLGSPSDRYFNGMGCLAAQYIAETKEGAGNLYIEPPGATGRDEEYVYVVKLKDKGIHLGAYSVYKDRWYSAYVDNWDIEKAKKRLG